MAAHILTMSALAPFLAVLIAALRDGNGPVASNRLGLATAAQIALLYAWHAPKASAFLEAQPAAHLLMHVSLLGASLLFWLAVLAEDGPCRWRGVAALAITGKLSCLLGALLLFAPRVLDAPFAHADSSPGLMLADQRFAGLLMLAICPFSYVLPGVLMTARWLRDMEARDQASDAALSLRRGQ